MSLLLLEEPGECCLCGEEAKRADSEPSGTGARNSRKHVLCRSIQRASARPMLKDPRFKVFFAELKAQYLKLWYCKQEALGMSGKGSARAWDDTMFEEWEQEQVGSVNKARIHWDPYTEFEERHERKGWETSKIKKEWERLRVKAWYE